MAKTERIEIRTELDAKQRLEAAAQLTGEPVSQFVLDSAIERANQILGPGAVTVWPAQQYETLLEALNAPQRPLPKFAAVHGS